MVLIIKSQHEKDMERLKALSPPNRVRNNQLWRHAVKVAKRIGGRRKNDMDYIMSIYKRLGGTLKGKGNPDKVKGPLDDIKLEGCKYGSKSS